MKKHFVQTWYGSFSTFTRQNETSYERSNYIDLLNETEESEQLEPKNYKTFVTNIRENSALFYLKKL